MVDGWPRSDRRSASFFWTRLNVATSTRASQAFSTASRSDSGMRGLPPTRWISTSTTGRGETGADMSTFFHGPFSPTREERRLCREWRHWRHLLSRARPQPCPTRPGRPGRSRIGHLGPPLHRPREVRRNGRGRCLPPLRARARHLWYLAPCPTADRTPCREAAVAAVAYWETLETWTEFYGKVVRAASSSRRFRIFLWAPGGA